MVFCGCSETQNHLDIFVFILLKQRLSAAKENKFIVLFSPIPITGLTLSHSPSWFDRVRWPSN